MLNTDLIRPVGELLRGHAAQRGDRPAFRDDERAEDWAGIERRTAALAAGLRRRVDHGDTVAICMGNRVEGVESYLGVVRAGAVAAYLNPSATDPELGYMLRDSAAKLLITDRRLAARSAQLAEHAPAIERVVVVDGDDEETSFESLLSPGGRAPDDLALDEPAFLLYTSGTTGRPKGVVLTQRSTLWVVAACWTTALGLTAEDDLLSALPLFHSYALDLTVLAVAATGCSERLLPRFSVHRVLDALREEDVSVFAGVPTMFHYIVDELDGEPLGARALRVTASAGAIMAGSLMEAFEAASGVPLLDGYGITETSTMVTMNWPTGARPPGSCGLPVPGCAVRLVDPSGADVPSGEEGELIVRGPQVMQGYLNQPEASADALRDGWYHSGDLARADPSGYLTITGRIKELIIRGGENIYPAEVEQAVAEHPAVADAAVVGVPDERLGETVLAFIVVADGAEVSDEELREFAAGRLTDFKVPERFERIAEIPRTGSGKVQRHKLTAGDADAHP